jgi:hypothetical protein
MEAETQNTFEYLSCFYVCEFYNTLYKMVANTKPNDFVMEYIRAANVYAQSISSATDSKYYDKSVGSLIKYFAEKDKRYKFTYNSFHEYVAKTVIPKNYQDKVNLEKSIFFTHKLIVELVISLSKQMTNVEGISKVIKTRNTENTKYFIQIARAILVDYRTRTFNEFGTSGTKVSQEAIANEKLKDDNKRLIDQNAHLSSKIETYKKDINDLKDELEEVLEKEADYRKVIALLRAQVKTAQAELERLKNVKPAQIVKKSPPEEPVKQINISKSPEVRKSPEVIDYKTETETETESESDTESESETETKSEPKPDGEYTLTPKFNRFKMDREAFFNS